MSTLSHLDMFWFGEGSLDDPQYIGARMRIWFGKDPEFDQTITREFRPMLEDPPPATSDREVLARVLLLDQIPRNGYRGDARMFAFDAQALVEARTAIEGGVHARVHPFEAMFLYLPLEHSESLADQDECVRLFTELQARIAPELKTFGESVLDYARRHRVIVERFGRFPHRNAVLGRTSTPEEVEFLKTPGSGF